MSSNSDIYSSQCNFYEGLSGSETYKNGYIIWDSDNKLLRLADGSEYGSDIYEGRVEIYHNNEWGTICNDNEPCQVSNLGNPIVLIKIDSIKWTKYTIMGGKME